MRIAAIVILVSIVGALAPADSDVPGISEQALESLRENLADYADIWLETGEEDATVGLLLDSVWYADESLLLLRVALAARYEDDAVDLYVTEALLRPLEYVDPDVVAEALPIVAVQIERIGQYRTDLTDQEQSLMAIAQSPVEEAEIATRQRQREQGEALLDERAEAIRTTQLYNEKVHAMRTLQVRLQLLADTDAADAAVLEQLSVAQTESSRDYFDILRAIRFEAEFMGEERATVYYDGLKALWQVDNMSPRSYVDYRQVMVTEGGGLTFLESSAKPGPELLRTLNHVACYARKPALRVR